MSIIGIYHGDCSDGTGAAAVLLKKFPAIKLFPLKHHYTDEDFAPILEAVDTNTAAYFVDFALGVERLLDRAREITVIDHHISEKERMEALAKEHENLAYVFDNEKSGATLAWAHFFGEETTPELLRLIQDVDIWQWKFGDRTKHLSRFLIPYVNQPDVVLGFMEQDIAPLLEKGGAISDFADYVIESFAERAEPTFVMLGEHKVPAFNAQLMFVSEIGHALSKRLGAAVLLYSIREDRVHMSFRSIEGQSPTALDLAQAVGGGGHTHAAGGYVPLREFCEMIVHGTNTRMKNE